MPVTFTWRAIAQTSSTGVPGGGVSGVFTRQTATIPVVNYSRGQFGAGWGIEGYYEIFDAGPGSVLLVDGNGNETIMRYPETVGEVFGSEDGDLSAGVVIVSLLIAAFWGAAHALTPGHGKALVAGYLVGARGRPRHAFLLGGTVTITHTAGVFGLGLVTLGLSQFVVPEQLSLIARASVSVHMRLHRLSWIKIQPAAQA